MRSFKFLACCGAVAAVSPFFLQAQFPAPAADAKATTDAIASLAAQQKTMADNQSKIEEKLADIAENIRVARIYSSRAK